MIQLQKKILTFDTVGTFNIAPSANMKSEIVIVGGGAGKSSGTGGSGIVILRY